MVCIAHSPVFLYWDTRRDMMIGFLCMQVAHAVSVHFAVQLGGQLYVAKQPKAQSRDILAAYGLSDISTASGVHRQGPARLRMLHMLQSLHTCVISVMRTRLHVP